MILFHRLRRGFGCREGALYNAPRAMTVRRGRPAPPSLHLAGTASLGGRIHQELGAGRLCRSLAVRATPHDCVRRRGGATTGQTSKPSRSRALRHRSSSMSLPMETGMRGEEGARMGTGRLCRVQRAREKIVHRLQQQGKTGARKSSGSNSEFSRMAGYRWWWSGKCRHDCI